MPRRPRPWFRFYTEALHDQKLRCVPPAQRWVWVAILAAARQSPIPGALMVSERRPMEDYALADLAGVPVRDVRKALVAFCHDDMIEIDETIGAWRVVKWSERQFESDDITERTRKHRSNGSGRNVPTLTVGTPPETETEKQILSSSSSDSTGPVDNSVPDEVWDVVAELKLRRQSDVIKNPVPWKRSTALNARSEWGDLAALWWHEFDLTPRRLAECLMDGQVRNAQRRVT